MKRFPIVKDEFKIKKVSVVEAVVNEQADYDALETQAENFIF